MLLRTQTTRRTVYYVGALSLILIAVRLVMSLTHAGGLGVDGGAYLLHARGLLGMEVASDLYFDRPILAPGWLFIPFMQLLGWDTGYKVWESIFSTIPMIPAAALLSYRLLPRRLAPIAVVFVALNPWHWEMVVTGAVPLIGIGFILLCLWGLIAVSEGTARWYDKLAVVGTIAIIPYMNQTSTGLAGVALPMFLVGMALFSRSWLPVKRAVPFMAAGALLAVPAIGLYYQDVFFGSSMMAFPGPKVFIPTGYTAAWLTFGYGSFVVWHIVRRATNPALLAVSLVLLTHSCLPLFWSYDESIINIFFRSQHIASPLLMILGTWYVAGELQTVRNRRNVAIGVGVAVAAMVVASIWTFYKQTTYSDMMTPNMLEAMELVPTNNREAIIATNGSTAFWVSALKDGTPTYWTFSAEPHPAGQVWYPTVECVLGWSADCNPVAAAASRRIRWVLVDTRFPVDEKLEPPLWGAPPGDPWAPLYTAPWLQPRYSKGTVRLWEVSQ